MVNTHRSQPRSQQFSGSGSSGGSGTTAWRANALARSVEINARASLRLLGRLVAGGKIDEVVRRLAAAHALDVLDDLRDRRARLGERGGMRRDGDAGMEPQRVPGRQRLAIEDVEVSVR